MCSLTYSGDRRPPVQRIHKKKRCVRLVLRDWPRGCAMCVCLALPSHLAGGGACFSSAAGAAAPFPWLRRDARDFRRLLRPLPAALSRSIAVAVWGVRIPGCFELMGIAKQKT